VHVVWHYYAARVVADIGCGGQVAVRDGLWVEVTPSEHAHERAALNFLRERLPDREPFRVWSNFTFQAEDGRRYEVDLLVVTPTEVFLVEVKSHPNRIDGDAGTWVWTTPDGKRRTFDNPLRLAESKAKKLKSLLLHQDALRDPRLKNRRGPDGKKMRDGFYVRAVVFLSDPTLKVGLDELGRSDVYGPDLDPGVDKQANDLPGIVARLTDVPAHARNRIDRPLSAAIAKAVDQAGVRQSQALRQAGHYRLDELVTDGDGWQDFIAQQPMTKDQRRIRLYLISKAQTEEERLSLARAAEREYRFLQGIDHPGIEKPLEVIANPQGPALVFPHDPQAQRLDRYLDEHADELGLYDRIELVRQLAETLRAAHRAGLYHRALAPQHVTVTPSSDGPRLKIRDWQAAARELTAVAMSSSIQPATGTSHVARLVSEQAHVYIAPEMIRLGEGNPRAADMWSLGAVSYLILTGTPPAADLDGLYATLKEHEALTLAAGMDAPDQALEDVIRYATRVVATDRFVAVDEFLEYLDVALEELTSEPLPDPIDAKRGDEFGDWKVLKRFGVGSTAVVLLVERDGRPEVLKVARDEDHADRLRDEAEVLSELEGVRSPAIVASYGLLTLGSRTALRLEAAQTTLSRLLEQEGPLSIDRFERFGQDLLDALVVLEQEGIAHRDIKPDNLGVIERGKNKERHLVLFDFSLTRTDATNLHAGTAAYLDPFLTERASKRWDLQAERYAAAVTLHEMATGQRPEWGDGATDPLLTDLQVPSLALDVVDPSIRGALTSFLERALNRDPVRRFDTAADMRQGFDQLFAEVDVPATATATDDGLDPADVEVAGVTVATPLTDLGLAPRIVNVLERLGTVTAGDLAQVPPHELSRLSGFGAAVRREVANLAERLRRALEDVEVADDGDVPSIDRLIGGLVPRSPADEDHRTAVRAFLGLVPGPVADWPSQRQVAEQAELERAVVADALGSARTRWRNRPELTAIRAELSDLLRTRDGVAGGDELATALLATRGSLEGEPVRTHRARAVVRAALEAEATLQSPRFVHRRIDEVLLVALDGQQRTGDEVAVYDADALFDLAAELGEVADTLAAEQPLAAPDRVVARLREVPRPEGAEPMTDARLVRLAAAASRTAAVSSRLELYPIGMDPVRAVAEARGALLARGGLEAKDVRARVAARFPRATALPSRPALDTVLTEAGTGLVWEAVDAGPGRYHHPERGGVLATSYLTGTGSSTTYATPDDRELARREVDERLERIADDGGFLALTVARRDLDRAAHAIVARSGAVHVDLDTWLIEQMRAEAGRANARWDNVLQADADPDGATFRHVRTLIARALPTVRDRLVSTAPLVVVTGLGLLARYDQLPVVEELRDQLTRHRSRQAATLQGLIVLIPGVDPGAMPILDGHPIPVTTANQWAHLPSAWLTDTGAAA